MATMRKAFIVPVTGKDRDEIEVLFNPAEYSLEKSNQYQSNAVPGLALPVHQFVNGQADTLQMELFFDTYTDGHRLPVTDQTDKLARLLDIDAELHAPPVVQFVWGRFQFTAIIERLTQRFTMFLDDGTPVRATITVVFKEYKTVAQQLREMGRQSADLYKRHVVKEGESDQLWLIAAAEYTDPSRWRRIADVPENGITNPRFIESGRTLLVPPLD